jgi:hypothetical protein
MARWRKLSPLQKYAKLWLDDIKYSNAFYDIYFSDIELFSVHISPEVVEELSTRMKNNNQIFKCAMALPYYNQYMYAPKVTLEEWTVLWDIGCQPRCPVFIPNDAQDQFVIPEEEFCRISFVVSCLHPFVVREYECILECYLAYMQYINSEIGIACR